jgi:hypothetical protein
MADTRQSPASFVSIGRNDQDVQLAFSAAEQLLAAQQPPLKIMVVWRRVLLSQRGPFIAMSVQHLQAAEIDHKSSYAPLRVLEGKCGVSVKHRLARRGPPQTGRPSTEYDVGVSCRKPS